MDTATIERAATPIRTPDQRLRVFVSSTLGELAAERAVVRHAIEQLHLTPVMFELGARPHAPRDLYRAYLEQSDVFVGVYGERYGWVAPGEDVSGLEDEYRLSGSLPRLIYIKDGVDRQPKLTELLDRIRDEDTSSYRRYSTVEELETMVADDLAVLLSERFVTSPPVAITGTRRRLPTPTTALFGRDREIAGVRGLIERGDVRLVTLTGPGGIGKTRLSLAVASQLVDRFDGEVYFVPLAAITDEELVPHQIGEAIGADLSGNRSACEAVVQHIGDRNVLLVLDNLEQVPDVARHLAEFLERCPNVVLLVTSRTVLRIRGEHEYIVPSLELDDHGCAACDLFVDRARQVRPDFDPSPDDLATIHEIARRLDGLPLAIELAAARIRVLRPHALLERLARSSDVLSGGPDLPERQRTLRATIEWSYDLLDEPERALLARLSVFSGGWTLEGAEAVAADEVVPDVLAALSSLVEHSLVRLERNGTDRFRMLETIRDYASARLRESGETERFTLRHAAHFLAYAEERENDVRGVRSEDAMDELDHEHDNIRAALRTMIDSGDLDGAAGMAFATWVWYWLRDRSEEGRAWCEEIFAKLGDNELTPVRHARLVWATGAWRFVHAEYESSRTLLLDALGRSRMADDTVGAIASLLFLSFMAPVLEDDEAMAAYVRASIDQFVELGDHIGASVGYGMLAFYEMLRGDLDAALDRIGRSVDLAERMGSDVAYAQSLNQLGWVLAVRGDFTGARDAFRRSAARYGRRRQREGVAMCLEGLAQVLFLEGDARRAATLLGSASAVRDQMRTPVWPVLRGMHEQFVDALREAMGPDAYADALDGGRRLDPKDVIDLALAADTSA